MNWWKGARQFRATSWASGGNSDGTAEKKQGTPPKQKLERAEQGQAKADAGRQTAGGSRGSAGEDPGRPGKQDLPAQPDSLGGVSGCRQSRSHPPRGCGREL